MGQGGGRAEQPLQRGEKSGIEGRNEGRRGDWREAEAKRDKVEERVIEGGPSYCVAKTLTSQ